MKEFIMSYSDKPAPEREIVSASRRQKEHIESLNVFDKALKHLTRVIIAAIIGYIIYLFVDTTPTSPVAAASTMTPEQVREEFALFTSLLGSAVALWCLYGWRTLWQWTIGVTKQLLQRRAK
jgi:E3 ubiquitin-protein ligase DOA10